MLARKDTNEVYVYVYVCTLIYAVITIVFFVFGVTYSLVKTRYEMT
jgi:hypothetical protein